MRPAGSEEDRADGLRHLVVMGVSGTGKTSVAVRLAESLHARFLEGDDHHPEANIEKMRAGVPLTDGDRGPWLQTLARLVRDSDHHGVATVLTCSALRRRYRDVLRSAVPPPRLLFVHLHAPTAVLEERMSRRTGHYMPSSLLLSQLETLEPLGADERGVLIDVSTDLDGVVAAALASLRPAVTDTGDAQTSGTWGRPPDDRLAGMDLALPTRRVTEDDWETWREIRLRSLRDSPDAFSSTYEREAVYDEARWRDLLRRGPRVLVVDEGRTVALGGGFPTPAGVMVFGMWTDPAHRGRGHATAILEVVVGWARERELPVELHVNLANPGARATYERYGFVATGELEPLRPGSAQTIERMRLPQ